MLGPGGMRELFQRFLARQFARPTGLAGRFLIAPALDRIGRKLNELALDLLGPVPGEGFIDVGIGGGALLQRLLRMKPGRLAGVDLSDAAVRRAARRLRDRAEIVQASADALPFEAASFDGATCVSVLHFWPELDPPIREISRVLRPGGRLVLVFEPPEVLRRWPGHVHGFEMWSVDDVISAAARAGLVLETHREGHGRKPDFFVGLRFRKGHA